MIISFRHKGLKRLYEDDDRSKLPADMVERIRDILIILDELRDLKSIDRPTYRLHALKGDLRMFYAVTVRSNWRLIFKFDGKNISDLDLVDYH
jgi:toxin HigB-1